MLNHEHDEPYIVIEKHNDAGSLLVGVLIGAAVALLFAPRSGQETRGEIRRKARQAGDAVKGMAEEVSGQVADTYEGAKARVEEQIDHVRDAVVTRKRQVSRAIEAGREAALQARVELESQLAETKAAYNAGAGVARSRRKPGVRPLANDDATVETPPEAAPRAASVREDRVWTRSPLVSFGWTVRDYAKRVWDNAGEDNVLFLAGGIAFNILLAAVPFVLLLIWFLTFLLNKSSAGATEVVTHYLDRLVPSHEERPDSPYHLLLSQILSTHQRLPIWSSIGFIWFSTRLFGSLRTVLASVFDIENERSIIAGKIFDIEMTVLSTVLITANTLISTYVLLATNNSVQVLEDLGIRHDVMGQAKAWGSHLAASILLATMFFAIYKYLPVRRVRAKTAWVAAAFTTIAFELAKFLFTLYVGSFNPGSLYSGSIAAVVVLVIWVYYAALVFILGGEVGQVYELRRTRKRQREVFLN